MFRFAAASDLKQLLCHEKLQSPQHMLTFNHSGLSHMVTDQREHNDDYRFFPWASLKERGLISLQTWFAWPTSNTGSSNSVPAAVQLHVSTWNLKNDDLYAIRQLRFLTDGQSNNIWLAVDTSSSPMVVAFKATETELYFRDGNNTQRTRVLRAPLEVTLNLTNRNITCE